MKQKVIFALLLILGYFGAHSMKTKIDKRISVGSKNFKCKFQLKHTTTDVNLKRSKFSCTPKKLKLRKPVDIELESQNGFSFSGTIKINPNKILEMNVHFATTEPPQTTTPLPLPSSGSEEVDFKEIYTNVSSEIKDEYKHSCGIDTIEEEEISNRGFTLMEKDSFWANAEVPWSFVSNGDEMAKHAVHTDANVGLTKDDVKTVMAAMKQIEDKTCIKFNKVKPVKDQPWLFVSRDARANDKACQRAYVKSTYVGKDVAGLGDIYKRFGWVNWSMLWWGLCMVWV